MIVLTHHGCLLPLDLLSLVRFCSLVLHILEVNRLLLDFTSSARHGTLVLRRKETHLSLFPDLNLGLLYVKQVLRVVYRHICYFALRC